MKPLKVIIVDDNEPFRKALRTLLELEYKAEVIGEASCAEDFEAMDNHRQADIILMDVMMPEVDGITLAKKTLWNNSKLKIIAITMHFDKVYLESLVGAGFMGCIFKNNLFNELEIALDTVLNNNYYFPKGIKISNETNGTIIKNNQ